jgi:hypothetical protein
LSANYTQTRVKQEGEWCGEDKQGEPGHEGTGKLWREAGGEFGKEGIRS